VILVSLHGLHYGSEGANVVKQRDVQQDGPQKQRAEEHEGKLFAPHQQTAAD